MSKPHESMLRLLAGMTDGEQKLKFIRRLYDDGQLDDHDLYQLLVRSIERNPRYYFEQITENDLLKYMWDRFQGYPEALARALVRVCPDLFYGNPDWVTRLIIKLQGDKKLGAELGMITIAPSRGAGKGGGGLVIKIDESLLASIPREVQDLDVECRVNELLYWYSRDVELAHEHAQEEIDSAANDYERSIWDTARKKHQEYLVTEYDKAIKTINGRMFPAQHVRWWLSKSQGATRVLNIGDTGTYKTSFAAIAMREAGAKKVLVFCAPNARGNWAKELQLYYPHLKQNGLVDVIYKRRHVNNIAADAEFIIVGYSTLTDPRAVRALKAQDIDGIIWDESHYGKNVIGANPARRALGALEVIQHHNGNIKKLVACSATPWENSPDELAALACVLRPDSFKDPQEFMKSGAYASPRFLRALLDTCILDVSLHQVRDLPAITPKPWEDLFGAISVPWGQGQAELYQHIIDNVPETDICPEDPLKTVNGMDGKRKMRYLMYATVIPHVLEHAPGYHWPPVVKQAFKTWKMSGRLLWTCEHIDEHIDDSKFVVASGMNVQGVTQPLLDDEDIFWIGKHLKEKYGDEAVLLLDGSVTLGKKRDAVIRKWRTDPKIKILLVSMRTCPDSINLSVKIKDDPTVKAVRLIGFSLDWKPWKQFIGRFWREGLSVPMFYQTLIIEGTTSEALLELNRRKWDSQLMFRCRVPPTDEEWLEQLKPNKDRFKDLVRTPREWVRTINVDMRGAGEAGARAYLDRTSGLSTHGEVFARSFLEAQDSSASGHIARHMRYVLEEGLIPGGILSDPSTILDAGCGPATMARFLSLPIYGVDLNPWMIEKAREVAPELTANICEGSVSALDKWWTDKFRLTTCSMVLDWTERGSRK
ncbi:hypothetical protein HOI18_03520, partial [Candidatus Uhrbacteria bacterium]|nr:hypothetical protein [Candidatus Uhrbacteria bacterium]